MDNEFLISVAVTILIGLYQIGQTHYQINVAKEQREARQPSSPKNRLVNWLNPVIIVALCAITWIPYYLSRPSDEDLGRLAIQAWGGTPSDSGFSMIEIKGQYLKRFRSKYKVAALRIGYKAGMGDIADVAINQKSPLYDIRDGEYDLFINNRPSWGQPDIKPSNYALIIVPKGITMDQFQTLRQAEALGVKRIFGGFGP